MDLLNTLSPKAADTPTSKLETCCRQIEDLLPFSETYALRFNKELLARCKRELIGKGSFSKVWRYSLPVRGHMTPSQPSKVGMFAVKEVSINGSEQTTSAALREIRFLKMVSKYKEDITPDKCAQQPKDCKNPFDLTSPRNESDLVVDCYGGFFDPLKRSLHLGFEYASLGTLHGECVTFSVCMMILCVKYINFF